MLFDDIGSFPLPTGVDKNWVNRNLNTREYEEIVQKAFLMKVNAGVECPNYPQFQEMVGQFMRIIKNPDLQEGAYLISSGSAIIPEIIALEKIDYTGVVRTCITGPFELYYKEFGGVIYDDVLENIAISISRFAKNTLNSKLNVKTISIDEPSLGTNPELQPTQEQLENAFKHFSFGCDIQIHLHSPLYYTSLLNVDEIDVIGIETARDPEAIEFIDGEELDSYEKKLRLGIARSDIDSIVAEYNQLHNINIWGDMKQIENAVNELESVVEIFKRIENAYKIFEDRLAYVGPDCGLFSFPTQEIAATLLNNISQAVKKFKD